MAEAAIRTYFQCEACEYGSFEIKEIEMHMHETHTEQVVSAAEVDENIVDDVNAPVNKSDVELVFAEEDDNEEDAVDDPESIGIDADLPCHPELVRGAIDNCKNATKSSRSSVALAAESNSDSDPSDVIWSNSAVRLLIKLVREDMDKFSMPSTPKHYLWKGISWKMTEKGYNYTHVRCDNKWRSLKKAYRNARQLVRTGKTEGKKWKFYDVMDEFMAEQDLEVESNHTSTGDDIVANRRVVAPSLSLSSSSVTARKRRKIVGTSTVATDKDETADHQDKVETARERRHREKMEQMKRFNDLFELFVSNNKSIVDRRPKQLSQVNIDATGI